MYSYCIIIYIGCKQTGEYNMNKFTAVANMAIFLTEQTGSCLGKWTGKMSAKDQKALFGAFIGKGEIVIDGETETLKHVRKVCFGMDYDVTFTSAWNDIDSKVEYYTNNKGY